MSSKTTSISELNSGSYKHFRISDRYNTTTRYGFKWIQLSNGDVAFLQKIEEKYDLGLRGTQAIMYAVGVNGLLLSFHLFIVRPIEDGSNNYSELCSKQLYERKWNNQMDYYYNRSPSEQDFSFGEITETRGGIILKVLHSGFGIPYFYNPVNRTLS